MGVRKREGRSWGEKRTALSDSLCSVAVADKVDHELVDSQHELQVRVAASLKHTHTKSDQGWITNYQ